MGAQLLSYFQIGKETTPGTSVAAAKRYHPGMDSSFQIDNMNNFHEQRNVGRRNTISYATSQGTLVTINYQSGPEGASWNELQGFTQFPDGGTAVGSGTAVWTHSWGGTAAGAYSTYTIEFGDDTQEYEAEYCFAKNIGFSADQGGMTQMSATFVGRQSTKSTKTSLDAADGYRIPAYLWKIKYAATQAGLSGASFQSGFLKSFDLQIQTGLTEAKYLDGNNYFTRANEYLPVTAQLHMVVVHSSAGVSEFYDNMAITNQSPTPRFVRLIATGPSIGASAYAFQIDGCWIYDKVTPIGTTIDGETMLDVQAVNAYDDTWGKSLQTIVTNTRASLP